MGNCTKSKIEHKSESLSSETSEIILSYESIQRRRYSLPTEKIFLPETRKRRLRCKSE